MRLHHATNPETEDAKGSARNPATARTPTQASLPQAISSLQAAEFFSFKECKDLLQQRLARSWPKLFRQLTGWPLHIRWHGIFEFHDPDKVPVLCPKTRRQGQSIASQCADCLRRRWKLELAATIQGCRIPGLCGIPWYLAGVEVGGAWPVTLVLKGVPSATGNARALALLQVILQDLRTTIEAGRIRHELQQAQHQIKTLETEEARFRDHLCHALPKIFELREKGCAGNHGQQVTLAMLNYIEANYHRPMALVDVASVLKMNPSYLSNLFSLTTGVTFRHYLNELRLARAKDLLCNAPTQVCEVASKVGFASAAHFWRVFKSHTGLSPREWRGLKSPAAFNSFSMNLTARENDRLAKAKTF